MKHPELTISVVTYKTDPATLSACLDSILKITIPFACFVIDNSQDPATKQQISDIQQRLPDRGKLQYGPSTNVGYGRAHNIAVRQALLDGDSRFHLVMNPDICFESGTLEALVAYMDDHPQVGLVMPKVLYPDGSLQKLCKLLPTPGHLLARRFFPWLIKAQNARYQLEWMDYDKPFECPSLSGCFMFIRTDVFREVGLFDERFFMYFEDVDLVRRIVKKYKTVYCPLATVTHHYGKGSYSSVRLLLYHVASGIKYFNKWGWFFDRERDKINREMTQRINNAE
ncbi:MAG: glycosyltransferase family 2 protein [Phycisphaerae bacterium]|nr:glycosyltransferase family 2 protein [Phycisphaerae bacterium]